MNTQPTPRTADKSARANALLAGQRSGLTRAILIWSREDSSYASQQAGLCRSELAKVAAHEADMARAPEFFAPLVLGFQGDNGRAPLIRLYVKEADQEAEKRAAEQGIAA